MSLREGTLTLSVVESDLLVNPNLSASAGSFFTHSQPRNNWGSPTPDESPQQRLGRAARVGKTAHPETQRLATVPAVFSHNITSSAWPARECPRGRSALWPLANILVHGPERTRLASAAKIGALLVDGTRVGSALHRVDDERPARRAGGLPALCRAARGVRILFLRRGDARPVREGSCGRGALWPLGDIPVHGPAGGTSRARGRARGGRVGRVPAARGRAG